MQFYLSNDRLASFFYNINYRTNPVFVESGRSSPVPPLQSSVRFERASGLQLAHARETLRRCRGLPILEA